MDFGATWPPPSGRDKLAPRTRRFRPSKPDARTERALAGLTTHVLDVTRGGPAQSMRVELYGLHRGRTLQLIANVGTNTQGRASQALISAGEARVGLFELVF